MNARVGVIAIQGDYHRHIEAFGRAQIQAVEVRTPEELRLVDRIVIPGGESTTVSKLLERFGLGEAIKERAASGTPVWGTCMGLIVMAKEIEGHEQYGLDLLDVTVQRNAFGAQVHSFEDSLEFAGIEGEVLGVFIRAPIVTRMGDTVAPLASYGGRVVAVRSGNRIGTSFHPELTEDTRVHQWFADL